MCVPAVNAIVQGASMAIGVMSKINEYNQNSANSKYQTQLALANMNNAKNLAYEEKQKGIEEARKERISGIQKASMLMASNAANGFSVDSETNINNLESIYDLYDANAEEIQKKYNSSANRYFNQANNYLNQANKIQHDSKQNLFKTALTGLGSTTSVAQRWYKNGTIF